jgi:hypothetical protein
MPEAISQYRPTWLEKIRNAITEAVKYGHMKNVGPIDTGDSLLNGQLFQILASLRDEVPRASEELSRVIGTIRKGK